MANLKLGNNTDLDLSKWLHGQLSFSCSSKVDADIASVSDMHHLRLSLAVNILQAGPSVCQFGVLLQDMFAMEAGGLGG